MSCLRLQHFGVWLIQNYDATIRLCHAPHYFVPAFTHVHHIGGTCLQPLASGSSRWFFAFLLCCSLTGGNCTTTNEKSRALRLLKLRVSRWFPLEWFTVWGCCECRARTRHMARYYATPFGTRHRWPTRALHPCWAHDVSTWADRPRCTPSSVHYLTLS